MVINTQKKNLWQTFFLSFALAGSFFSSKSWARFPRSMTSSEPQFVGIDLPEVNAYYGVYQNSCQIKFKNRHKILQLIDEGESYFLTLEYLPITNAENSDLIFPHLSKKMQEVTSDTKKKFQTRLTQLNQKVIRFKKRKHIDDALGIYYLKFLAEKFEISSEQINERVKHYKDILKILQNSNKNLISDHDDNLYGLNKVLVFKEDEKNEKSHTKASLECRNQRYLNLHSNILFNSGNFHEELLSNLKKRQLPEQLQQKIIRMAYEIYQLSILENPLEKTKQPSCILTRKSLFGILEMHMHRIITLLEGTKDVYSQLAKCHRLDSQNRLKIGQNGKYQGFLFPLSDLNFNKQVQEKNIFEKSKEVFLRFHDEAEKGNRSKSLF